MIEDNTYDASDVELSPVTFANAKVIVLYDDVMPPLWYRHPIKWWKHRKTNPIVAWWRFDEKD